ncbi:MAG: RNA-binding protein [Balneolaceae bacterium]|jgi:RNA recognition motif-containing protein|nr:MAG: RNA-binding protein [Balneolaceae bacterium]
MNIYVGNLAWKTTDQDLEELFRNFGEVDKAFVIRDRNTKRSKGFGFIEMADENAAKAAIDALNNTIYMERTLVVNEAKPKEESE